MSLFSRVVVPLLTFSCASVTLAAPQFAPGDGFNLRGSATKAGAIVGTPERTGFAHNWFAGQLTGLTPGASLAIRVNMEGQDTNNKMNVGKWKGLRPFFSYADPTSYDAYTGYWRDQSGSWWSRDPFLEAQQRFAGNAQIPAQRAMAPQLAPQFLSADGAQWFPWQEIEDAKPGPKQTFDIKQTFWANGASVAMRVPFTATYLDHYVERLRQAQPAGVWADEIGKSNFGRSLWCIRVEDVLGHAPADRPTVVVFAREHATEHATSWSALGLLERLMDRSVEMDALRDKVRFLIVPLQDPDGAFVSRFEGTTERWNDPKNNTVLQEVLAYSTYFRDGVDKDGHVIALAVSLHNVEANEAPNFMTPFAQAYYRKATEKLNRPLFDKLKEAGFTVASPSPNGAGVMSVRLYGWIARYLGAMDLAYEVNDRDPENRLSVQGLKQIGAILGEELGAWLQSDAGQKRGADARAWLDKRASERTAFYGEKGAPTSRVARNYDLLVKGF